MSAAPPPPPPAAPSPAFSPPPPVTDVHEEPSENQEVQKPQVVYARNPSGVAALHGTTTSIRVTQIAFAVFSLLFLIIAIAKNKGKDIDNGFFYTSLVICILSTLYLIGAWIVHINNQLIFGSYEEQIIFQRAARAFEPPAFNTAMTTNSSFAKHREGSTDSVSSQLFDRTTYDWTSISLDFALGLLNVFSVIILFVKCSASVLVIVAAITTIFSSIIHLTMGAYSCLVTNIDHAEY